MNKKPLIIFLGNSLLSDDKVGLILGERLKERLEADGIDVEVLEKTGLALMDYLEEREMVVIVDSVVTWGTKIGEVVSLKPRELKDYAPFSPHYVGVPEAILLLEELDLNPPKHLHIIGIEVKDPYTISEKLSEELSKKLEELEEKIYRRIKELVSCQ